MAGNVNELVRALPSVDAVLQLPGTEELARQHGRQSAANAVRAVIDRARREILRGGAVSAPDAAGMARLAAEFLAESSRLNLKRVVNATGIILHTGLGRAAMPDAAREMLGGVTGYCNLQQDLQTGQRDRREECLRGIAKELTGAEDVLVVNNNAGATFLVLAALARGREVVISRGELIEIGGSFRLPDIMEQSGAVLREVGTTNKTHLKDYEKAVGPETAMIMKAHKSNYKIVGFSKEVPIADIVKAGRKHKVPVVDDLGCGALVGLEQFGLEHECTVRESIEAGSDVVLFSTDKLIGGPQGGMIVGRADLLEKVRQHPLYRVLRVCKMTLGALEATLNLFKAPDRLAVTHPVYRMIAKTPAGMETQAGELKKTLAAKQPGWEFAVSKEVSYLGGGSLPEADMPSFAVLVKAPDIPAGELAKRLRMAVTPVVGRVVSDNVVLDMRTVLPEDMPDIVLAIERIGRQ